MPGDALSLTAGSEHTFLPIGVLFIAGVGSLQQAPTSDR
jgi:hypothetical protein